MAQSWKHGLGGFTCKAAPDGGFDIGYGANRLTVFSEAQRDTLIYLLNTAALCGERKLQRELRELLGASADE